MSLFNTVLPNDYPSSTKGVAIIYGWMGSIPKYVQKYADLYTTRDWAVVYGTAPLVNVAVRDESALDKVAIESVVKASKIVREVETATEARNDVTIPVILHYFSNGGAFVAESLARLIQEAKRTDDEEERSSVAIDPVVKQDLRFISDRLHHKGYEIIDSAPAYLYDSKLYHAIDTAIPNLFLRIPTKMAVFTIHIFNNNIVRKIQKKDSPAIEFWKNTIESDLCLNQVYIYSVKDSITVSKDIDELIEERKKLKPDVTITTVKFEDSEHVMHLRRYPKEYMEIIDSCLLKAHSKLGKK